MPEQLEKLRQEDPDAWAADRAESRSWQAGTDRDTLATDMVVVVPLTGHDRGLVTRPRINGLDSGLRQASFARPEDMRAIDASRLQRRLGRVSNDDLAEIRKVMRYFLDL